MFRTLTGGLRASKQVLIAKSKTAPINCKKISSSAPRRTDVKKVEAPPDFRDTYSELDIWCYKERYANI